jgi:hypothetical protein
MANTVNKAAGVERRIPICCHDTHEEYGNWHDLRKTFNENIIEKMATDLIQDLYKYCPICETKQFQNFLRAFL